MSRPARTAPTASCVLLTFKGAHAAALGCAGVGNDAARSAHSGSAIDSAADLFVRHARADAEQAAQGDKARLKRLKQIQGEILIAAGLRMIGEADRHG